MSEEVQHQCWHPDLSSLQLLNHVTQWQVLTEEALFLVCKQRKRHFLLPFFFFGAAIQSLLWFPVSFSFRTTTFPRVESQEMDLMIWSPLRCCFWLLLRPQTWAKMMVQLSTLCHLFDTSTKLKKRQCWCDGIRWLKIFGIFWSSASHWSNEAICKKTRVLACIGCVWTIEWFNGSNNKFVEHSFMLISSVGVASPVMRGKCRWDETTKKQCFGLSCVCT